MAMGLQLSGKLLVTGHTGFKGTWLTLLAETHGIEVVGISLPPDKNSLYTRLNRANEIEEYFVDINDELQMKTLIQSIKPTHVLHLAAQALVAESYVDPIHTFQTNVIGTANVLDACLETNSVSSIGVATTDKVYRNENNGISFIERDPLGGKDPYSASKVGTESVIDSWRQLSELRSGPPIISLRAGNVIGGGDMAENRIIPDLIRSKVSGTPAVIRNSQSTRPWQHVLDPLVGYLLALQRNTNQSAPISALNFGPTGRSLKVSELVEIARKSDPSIPNPIVQNESNSKIESKLLSLNSEQAMRDLSWSNSWSQEDAIRSSIEWWKNVLSGTHSAIEACTSDIKLLLI